MKRKRGATAPLRRFPDFYREGFKAGQEAGRFDVRRCRDEYDLLLQLNGATRSLATYRQFLHGQLDGVKKSK
jgi:hypothetical protein